MYDKLQPQNSWYITCVCRRNTVCFRYIIVNILHKDTNKDDDDDNNNNNGPCVIRFNFRVFHPTLWS
jgi:hypothetical protein